MPRELQALINTTIEASHLPDNEKELLRKELYSHILAHIYELEVAGKTEAEIIAIIKEEFGDTEEIGKEMFYVHHRLERLPWFGPFFYYQPLRYALQLVLITAVVVPAVYIVASSTMMFSGLNYVPIGNIDGYMQLFIGAMAGIGAIVGLIFARRAQKYSYFLEAVALSCIPYAAIALFLYMNVLLRSGALFMGVENMLTVAVGAALYIGSIVIGGALYWLKAKKV